MIESAIESLARSGRIVRIRELCLGYMRPGRAALSGAAAGLFVTWTSYLWYVALVALSLLLRLVSGQTLNLGPPPEFRFFAAGEAATVAALVQGAVLALVRRWSIRRGRFILIQVGPVAQLRAGWHAPLAAVFFVADVLLFSDWPSRYPPGFARLALGSGAIAAVIGWETLHDWTLPFFGAPGERRRAVIEYDLKEALIHDETAVRWRVESLRFEPKEGVAILRGEFPDERARARAKEVAMRVRGVKEVRLEQL